MAIFSGSLIDVPGDLAKLANDGRINLVSSTSIRWDGSVVGLWNGSSWAVCKPATLPSAINTSTDMNGTALAVDKIYDVFLNYSSVTSCPFAFSSWAVSTAGSSARNAAYAAGTAYAIGDRVTSGGNDYTCIQAGTGQTPSSSPTYWVDNGTSITGDFAGLYRHDGVLVSHNSDAGKKLRWLGCIYTYSNSGTVNFKDEDRYRYISNYYNRISSALLYRNTTATTWTYSTAAWRTLNNGSGREDAEFICCVTTTLAGSALIENNSAGGASACANMGIAIDSTSTPLAQMSSARQSINQTYGGGFATSVAAGKHYKTMLEYAQGDTICHGAWTGVLAYSRSVLGGE